MASLTSQPMYKQIKEDLIRQIESGALKAGERIPTEQQLMAQYRVSRITISKAVNELKNEGLVERFPNRGTFVTAAVSPSLVHEAAVPENTQVSEERIPEIACIIPSVTDLFSLGMVNGILSAFPENEYICHLFQSRNPQIENYLLKRCLDSGIAGIVLFPQDQPFFSNELLYMQLQKYPLVLIDRYLPRLDTSYVIADNAAGGGLCVTHLHELGHQRIAFLTATGRDTFSIKHRIAGVYAAAEKLGMPESAIRIVDHFHYLDPAMHYEDLLLSLYREDRITAFVAAESGLCAYLYRAFLAINLSVPGHVSLMSFDRPLTEFQNPNFFTHINQSEAVMGREAGSILRRRIEQRDMNVYHRVTAPTLEVCSSTGRAVL